MITLSPAPPTLPNATIGVPYSVTITASGGVAPYSFSLGFVPLPTGLILTDNGDGTTTISGTPTTITLGRFSIDVTDSSPTTQGFPYAIAVLHQLTPPAGFCQTEILNVVPVQLFGCFGVGNVAGVITSLSPDLILLQGGTTPVPFTNTNGITGLFVNALVCTDGGSPPNLNVQASPLPTAFKLEYRIDGNLIADTKIIDNSYTAGMILADMQSRPAYQASQLAGISIQVLSFINNIIDVIIQAPTSLNPLIGQGKIIPQFGVARTFDNSFICSAEKKRKGRRGGTFAFIPNQICVADNGKNDNRISNNGYTYIFSHKDGRGNNCYKIINQRG